SGCWLRTIAATVASRSEASRTLRALGSSTSARPRCGPTAWRRGFLQVDDEALADDRVERRLERAAQRRSIDHVPDQEAVIEARQRRIVVAHADGALEPPVVRVQGVGVRCPPGTQARAAKA